MYDLHPWNEYKQQVKIERELLERGWWPKAEAEKPDQIGPALRGALEAAISSRDLIEAAQSSIRSQPLRDGSDTERAAREYQIDLVAWQIDRAAEIGQERLSYIEAIQSPQQIQDEIDKCAADTIHWFKYYAWGFDPRPDAPLQNQPFVLFDFQSEYIKWLESLVFDQRASGLVEKARDMGATIGALNWVCKQWRFRDGFSAMLTSATEDLVDSKKDPDTLFEKVRFQLKLLPEWMLPAGFNLDRDTPYMNIANPVNGSVITGSAPTAKVGRQRRRTMVLMDEFATWPFSGYPQYTALSQTARSLLMLATPEGRFNKYAEVRHSGHANVFTMDWREHPWKDQRWRNALPYGYTGPVMSEQQIAQEIERDYDASQPGKVFKQWKEEYCLITWTELIEFYKQFKLDRKFVGEAGQRTIPVDWNWCRTHDHGQTDSHPWIVTHAARPRANYPLSDSIFVFSCHRIDPTGASVAEAQPQITKIEKALGLRSLKTGKHIRPPNFSTNSHEAIDVRATFLREHGENWLTWSTDYNVGIPQMQEWMYPIEPHRPNPIRPELMGRSRIYFVADDSEYRLVFNEQSGKHFVTPSATDEGFKLLREEIPAYHYPPEEIGKPPREMRPLKIKDDVIDTLRAIATKWGPSVAPKTEQEQIEAALPDGWKTHQIEQHDPELAQRMFDARNADLNDIKKSLINNRRPNVDYAHIADEGGGGDI